MDILCPIDKKPCNPKCLNFQKYTETVKEGHGAGKRYHVFDVAKCRYYDVQISRKKASKAKQVKYNPEPKNIAV